VEERIKRERKKLILKVRKRINGEEERREENKVKEDRKKVKDKNKIVVFNL
jgi:hypothetical protein